MNHVVAILVAIVLFVAPNAFAQGSGADAGALAALQTAAKADKRALVASTLKLTSIEAKKFWPAYDSYQRTADLLTRRRNVALEGLVSRDQPMSDLYARNFTNELISVEEQEIKARRKMSKAAMRALPPRKAAIYMQLEWKLRIAQAYDIAVAFPLGQVN